MDRLMKYGSKKLAQYQSGGMREILSGKQKAVRLGIIGTGRHARTNLFPVLPFLPVRIKAVCAAHKENAELYGAKYGAEAFYESSDEMLANETLDAIICCVNAEVHAAFLAKALSQDIPVFCEKPAAPSTADLKNLCDSDPENLVQVGFQKRFVPNYQLLKQVIADKTYGNLNNLQMEFGVGAYTGSIKAFMLEVGIHFIDLLRYLVPAVDIKFVLKQAHKTGKYNYLIGFGGDHEVIGTLLLSSNFDWQNGHERVLANFEKTNVVIENLVNISKTANSRTLLSIPLEKVTKKRILHQTWHPNYISGEIQNSSLRHAGFLPELAHFADWVLGRTRNNISNLENALKTHSLMDIILSS